MRYDVGRISIAAVWQSIGIMTESQEGAGRREGRLFDLARVRFTLGEACERAIVFGHRTGGFPWHRPPGQVSRLGMRYDTGRPAAE